MQLTERSRVARLLVPVVALVMLCVFGQSQVRAGGGPENAVLVINDESRSSRVIANHYIALRNIPPNHVIYLKGIPAKSLITLDVFRKKILEPLLQEVVKRKIQASTDYIIYSSDFPTRIDITEHRDKLNEIRGGRDSKVYNPTASLTSMTYFASQVLLDDPSYMELNANRYYRIPYRSGLAQPFYGEVQDEYRTAVSALKKTGKEFEDAKQTLLQLSQDHPGQPAVYYQLARFLGKSGEASEGLKTLSHAVAMGWRDAAMIDRERDFDSLRADPKFDFLMTRARKSNSPFVAAHGFRNAYSWAPNGMINKAGQGQRYLLSAVLSVTRYRGISDRDSLKYLSRAVSADATHPRGSIYYTKTGDVRSKTRQSNFAPAVAAIKQLGYEARISTDHIPKRRNDILGLSSGVEYARFEKTGSSFLPGAIADNLTSVGGYIKSPAQTKITEFLKHGAAGACGTVVEPFALQVKFPHPMIHAHYLSGCSLAEAFYQSVQGPFQIILIGDPLCQPFVNRPKIVITSPAPLTEVTGKLKIELSRAGSKVKAAGVEVFLNGGLIHRAGNVNSINIDTLDLKDGFHELRVVAVGRDSIEARGSAVLPILVNNNGHSVDLEIENTSVEFPDLVRVSVKADYGDTILLRQNFKTVGVIKGQSGSTTISSGTLGVGNVKLQAIAFKEGETVGVASLPIEVSVTGLISSEPAKR